MTTRIYIAIPVFNRVAIAAQCIPTVRESMYAEDHLAIYDDGSTESTAPLFAQAGPNETWTWGQNIGVDAQRRQHIFDFWAKPEFTHLYFSDADAFVEPHWRSRLLEIQDRTGLLTCGYHTKTHEEYVNNVYARKDGIVFTRFAPGVSYLLNREHVAKIIEGMPERWSFDWHIPSILGYKCAVSDVSCVDHIGVRGQHDPADGSLGPEKALNPTEWLKAKRAEIVSTIKDHEC